MTGKEKIQAVIDVIDEEYQGLVTGNVVEVYSGTLESKGLSLDEQQQVLDILANDKQVIKYTSKHPYESQSDIDPQTQVDIMEVASMNGISEHQMFQDMLDALTYSVEVLNGFEKLTTDKVDQKVEYQTDLYALRILYNRIIIILDAKVATGILVEDERLNHIYLHLSIFIDDILSKKQFAKLKAAAPEIYPTLMGNAEDIGEGWEYDRKAVLHFYALLEREWIIENKPQPKLPKPVDDVLKQVDEAVASHKLLTKEAKQRFDQQSKLVAERFQTQFGQPQAGQTASYKKAKPTKPIPKQIEVHKLQPNHYSSRTGVLWLSPTDKVAIAKRGKVKRKDGSKYDQCWLLECLFKTVNTLKSGVNFSTVLGVNKTKIGKNEVKKIRNTVDAINEKVADESGVKSLIKIQAEKVFVNSSYL